MPNAFVNGELWLFALAIPVLQAALMFFDEGYYHRTRGLPDWERWGHPLDTLSVLACLAIVYFLPITVTNVWLYSGLAAFSCLWVTKDESIHARHCLPGEMHIHALLFILHPLLFWAGYQFWKVKEDAFFILTVQLAATVALLIWQIFYWNFGYGKSIKVIQNGTSPSYPLHPEKK